MKKTIKKVVDVCDACRKEDELIYTCRSCKVEFCYDCQKKLMKKYHYSTNFSGTHDSYYCHQCDTKLTVSKKDKLHNLYKTIELLTEESKKFWDNFKIRSDKVEKEIIAILTATETVKVAKKRKRK